MSNLNTSITLNGNVNGLNINQSGNTAIIPSGSIADTGTVLVSTGIYQQIFTASVVQNVGQIALFNQSATSSVNFAISYSGGVSNVGQLAPFLGVISAGNTGTPSLIQWNQEFNGLYAQAVSSASFVVYALAAQ